MFSALRQRNLTERTSSPKESTLPKKSVRDLHLEDFVSGKYSPTSSGSYTRMRPSSISTGTRGRWTRVPAGPLRSSGTSRGETTRKESCGSSKSFNGSLTKDEEQLQFPLQVVADHRKAFPETPGSGTLAHTRPQ
ncbi:hypothetical protein GWK47_024641 [Chionoecetes opilio]|uniref:Uncharacterized protein n=1 Tax=Chionoecetes opilio TaxID=41210 RepID=A0A8J4XM46_CHIOP|nr:hypothetical protein GWK47_024641 [Chionoecetes opilio]